MMYFTDCYGSQPKRAGKYSAENTFSVLYRYFFMLILGCYSQTVFFPQMLNFPC